MKMNGNYNGESALNAVRRRGSRDCPTTSAIYVAGSWRGSRYSTTSLEQTVPRELRKSTDRNSLGTTIDGTEGARRLRDVHAMSSARKPLFLDLSIHQISKECGTNFPPPQMQRNC